MQREDAFPSRRAALLDAHEDLSERHTDLRGRESALLEHRELRDDLIGHRNAISEYHRDLASLSEPKRIRLELTKALSETELMLAETLEAIERAREAWKRATDAWQRVREKLDQRP